MSGRTREQVEREYEDEKWPAVERLVQETVAAESAPTLARVLGTVVRKSLTGDAFVTRRGAVFAGQELDVPLSVSYGAVRRLVLDTVIAACSERTQLVVELGSGPGWAVLGAWLDGGPQDATYVGAEYTRAGRDAADRLAALAPELDFRSLAFDYHEPDLGPLGHVEEAVVFTAHSIEQIPHVNPALFAAIRGLADRVTCLHFEPVGWQLGEDTGAGTSREYAEEHDYTRDLVPRLREEEAAGRISIDTVLPEVVGVNRQNSTTVIGWSAPARSS
jgi:hypothetical protein